VGCIHAAVYGNLRYPSLRLFYDAARMPPGQVLTESSLRQQTRKAEETGGFFCLGILII
jgi:hypothetical protein